MLIFFLSNVLAEINNIQLQLGIETYQFHLDEEDVVTINTSYYPSYIIFYNYPNDAIFKQYTWQNEDRSEVTKNEAQLRYLPLFQRIGSPYSSWEIHADSEGDFTFFTLSFPGMCEDGIYISTELENFLDFNRDEDGFFGFDEWIDKCALFAVPGPQNVTISINTNYHFNQIHIYDSYNSSTTMFPNETEVSITMDTPKLIRFMTYDTDFPYSLSIQGVSDVEEAYNPRHLFYELSIDPEDCKDKLTWVSEPLTITLMILAIITGIIMIIFCSTTCIKHNNPPPPHYNNESLNNTQYTTDREIERSPLMDLAALEFPRFS